MREMDLQNETSLPGCDGRPERSSCELSSSVSAVWDTIAALRMIISCLSLLGASSIIGSAVKKREVTHPKVHPIFSLAVADLSLALLWIIGGVMWLRGIEDRRWCFAISLFTVILLCVSVNLTVVYASVSYSITKKTDLAGLLANMDSASTFGWSPAKTALVYSIAWFLPVVIVLALFGVVAGSTDVIHNTNLCSCWCAPVLSNILPYALHRQQGTAEFVHDMRKLLVVYGVVITVHFLVGLAALVTLYCKCLLWIRKLKNRYNPSRTSCSYGSEGRGQRWALISKGESKAQKRVFYFLTVFIISGFFNFVFTFGVMVHEIIRLQTKEAAELEEELSFETFYEIFAILQAVSITQQGFLNAIVYGWTREDFLHIMAISGSSNQSALHQLLFSHTGGDSGELDATWALQEGGEEEEKEEEEKWSPSQTQSITPVLSHKLYPNL